MKIGNFSINYYIRSYLKPFKCLQFICIKNTYLNLGLFSNYQRQIISNHCVMVIDVGNGHGDKSSIPEQSWLHFTKY